MFNILILQMIPNDPYTGIQLFIYPKAVLKSVHLVYLKYNIFNFRLQKAFQESNHPIINYVENHNFKFSNWIGIFLNNLNLLIGIRMLFYKHASYFFIFGLTDMDLSKMRFSQIHSSFPNSVDMGKLKYYIQFQFDCNLCIF